MSHFTVAVITDSKPTEEDLAVILAPWHEFECTGLDDEYVVDVDRTAEMVKDFGEATSRVFTDPSETHHSPYRERFYEPLTPEEIASVKAAGIFGRPEGLELNNHRTRKLVLPEGWTDQKVPASQARSFADWVEGWCGCTVVPHGEKPDLTGEHKYGYALLDENDQVQKVIDRTNPNKKWDWWVIGGRWPNQLRVKGQPDGVDQAMVGALDLDAIGAAARAGRRESLKSALDRLRKSGVLEERARQEWAACARLFNAATEAWMAQREGGIARRFEYFDTLPADHPIRVAVASKVYTALGDHFSGIGIGEDDPDLDGWCETAPAFTTWALVKDGNWYESGKMGWWGLSIDDEDEEVWQQRVSKLVSELADHQWLTTVDCHI